jgi:hypothetical protein
VNRVHVDGQEGCHDFGLIDKQGDLQLLFLVIHLLGGRTGIDLLILELLGLYIVVVFDGNSSFSRRLLSLDTFCQQEES